LAGRTAKKAQKYQRKAMASRMYQNWLFIVQKQHGTGVKKAVVLWPLAPVCPCWIDGSEQ